MLVAPTMAAATPGLSSTACVATVATSDAAPVRDEAQRREKLLEERPASELVDHQPVLHQRAVLERLGGRRSAEPAIGEEPSGHRSVGEQRDAPRPAEIDHAVLGAIVEQRVLELVGQDRHARGEDLEELCGAEVRDAELVDLPRTAQPLQLQRHLHVPGDLEVPPVELHQVQPLHAEALERTVDDALDVRSVHGGQLVEVRHELGVDAQPGRVPGVVSPEAADQLLDAGVDVRAVEGGDARVDEGRHVADRPVRIDLAVVRRPGASHP